MTSGGYGLKLLQLWLICWHLNLDILKVSVWADGPIHPQVFILFSDGSIYIICPVVPFGRYLPLILGFACSSFLDMFELSAWIIFKLRQCFLSIIYSVRMHTSSNGSWKLLSIMFACTPVVMGLMAADEVLGTRRIFNEMKYKCITTFTSPCFKKAGLLRHCGPVKSIF